MKCAILILLIICVVGIMPIAAMDKGYTAAVVSISFFSIGLGTYLCFKEHRTEAYIVGGFQIAVGIFGIVGLACGWFHGGLLDQIKALDTSR